MRPKHDADVAATANRLQKPLLIAGLLCLLESRLLPTVFLRRFAAKLQWKQHGRRANEAVELAKSFLGIYHLQRVKR